ncbi:MAG TPA: hypothetical protein VMD99_05970 [Terriglobales bacterium]|nr:hypothetical protein [Terriglobales bacterium]
MKKRILVLVAGLWASVSFTSCGGSSGPTSPPSGLPYRVLASQSVSSTFTFGEFQIIDGQDDTIPRVAPIQAGESPGMMAISPSLNLVAAFDSGTNSVYSVNTVTEKSIGHVQLPGPTSSIVLPTSDQVGYAAVPTAYVDGYSFLGAVEVMNLAGKITTTIAVTNAQTVVSNQGGSQLLVFPPPEPTPNGINTVTVLSPEEASPPVDTSCFDPLPNAVCAVVSGFDRPVNAIVDGNIAYVLNCGPECGGTQASVMILNLAKLAITNTIPVDAATDGYLIGSTLYVAGNSPTNNACTNQTTAATTCGRLDTIDLTTNTVTSSIAITDGYHDRMDMSINGQLFIGSYDCTEIGNGNGILNGSNPTGEVRGCLTILNTNTGALVFPPENGDVNGLQSFTTREVEYVAQGGVLYVYNTDNGLDVLLLNDYILEGVIDVVGYCGDVKSIDSF